MLRFVVARGCHGTNDGVARHAVAHVAAARNTMHNRLDRQPVGIGGVARRVVGDRVDRRDPLVRQELRHAPHTKAAFEGAASDGGGRETTT